jgi:endoglucanase
MSDILPFLKSLISDAGLSGHERPVAALIESRWKPLADEMHASRLGSIHALRRGHADSPRPSILLSAHMDAVGLMVSGIEQGFLHVTNIGDVDARILPGQPVTVHGRQALHGVVTLLPAAFRSGNGTKLDDLLVDVGLPPRRVEGLVRVGDLVTFASEPVELGARILSGHSLDDRASVAALTLVLEAMQTQRHAWDAWFAATVQEETVYAGGITSAFALRPDLAVILDVTYARGGEGERWETYPLGGGLTLGIGPSIHPFLLKTLKETAARLDIPCAIEPMPELSLTEADAIQLVRSGIPTAVVGIPIRYMHMPVEVAALADIERAAALVAEFVSALEPDFLEKVTWDD